MTVELLQAIQERTCSVCIVGLGYVGLPVLRLATKRGFPASGLDIDPERVAAARKERLVASTDPRDVLPEARCVLISVPTPVDDQARPDLSAVSSASRTIAQHLRAGALVILESTVAPGTTEEVVVPLLEESGLVAGEDFHVAHCPERIDPGNKRWPLEKIPRIVGGLDEGSTEVAHAFYTELLNAEVTRMSRPRNAEAAKMVENAFRDVNVAFVNELAMSFDRLGIDVLEVIRGAATKPFGFMPFYPGPGVGGHCIGVDPYYLIEKASTRGFEHRFLKLAREINNRMPEYTVGRVFEALGERGLQVQNARIALLGLAYKGGVDDTRESPALPILVRLRELGAHVTSYDPYVGDSDASSLAEVLEGKDGIVLVTDHPEFQELTPEVLTRAGIRVVVDGRNMLDRQGIRAAGIVYKGVGR